MVVTAAARDKTTTHPPCISFLNLKVAYPPINPRVSSSFFRSMEIGNRFPFPEFPTLDSSLSFCILGIDLPASLLPPSISCFLFLTCCWRNVDPRKSLDFLFFFGCFGAEIYSGRGGLGGWVLADAGFPIWVLVWWWLEVRDS